VSTSKIYKGACHCKAVQYELTLANGIANPHRCDCSFCRLRGAITSAVDLTGLKIIKGEEKLTLYQFNTMTAKHYFCSICGIYTFHQRRSNPHQYGFNIACIEGINPYDFGEVPVMDGINHPADRKKE
jgi:hypothetical protein